MEHANDPLARAAAQSIPDRLLTVESSAELLAVSAAHVRRLARRGLLPSVLIGKCRRIPESVLIRVLSEGVPLRRPDTTRPAPVLVTR